MSIVFSMLLLLFLGFSCGAPALGVVADHHSINKESDEKLNPDHARVSMHNVKEGDDLDHDLEVDGGKVASERWKVPHRKKGEAEPGFNLDYLPPKTHPPVHN
ncbi:root meristem growth factor 10-like [Salvia miltiorrhiza]|uniref:root meristem growth factor 10-like n=1 Tax=Salvia miltiorrhiza TaxID=226208 RepID=UPI0025AD1CD2|nr:root meristem growth factor 10-like [Salvia miltiorrhiza]